MSDSDVEIIDEYIPGASSSQSAPSSCSTRVPSRKRVQKSPLLPKKRSVSTTSLLLQVNGSANCSKQTFFSVSDTSVVGLDSQSGRVGSESIDIDLSCDGVGLDSAVIDLTGTVQSDKAISRSQSGVAASNRPVGEPNRSQSSQSQSNFASQSQSSISISSQSHRTTGIQSSSGRNQLNRSLSSQSAFAAHRPGTSQSDFDSQSDRPVTSKSASAVLGSSSQEGDSFDVADGRDPYYLRYFKLTLFGAVDEPINQHVLTDDHRKIAKDFDRLSGWFEFCQLFSLCTYVTYVRDSVKTIKVLRTNNSLTCRFATTMAMVGYCQQTVCIYPYPVSPFHSFQKLSWELFSYSYLKMLHTTRYSVMEPLF